MAKSRKTKRGQGRPARNAVGPDTVLETATSLVQSLPPARVTLSLIAREAGVDPALIRYYFGDRTKLLLAVVERMLAEAPAESQGSNEPPAVIERLIRHAAHFTRSTKHVHRLMVDELADAKSAQTRHLQGQMNQRAVQGYADLMKRDGSRTLRKVDPLLLHLALVGVFDFFVSAQPVVRNLVPEGTDMDALGNAFENFVVDLFLNGLLKR